MESMHRPIYIHHFRNENIVNTRLFTFDLLKTLDNYLYQLKFQFLCIFGFMPFHNIRL